MPPQVDKDNRVNILVHHLKHWALEHKCNVDKYPMIFPSLLQFATFGFLGNPPFFFSPINCMVNAAFMPHPFLGMGLDGHRGGRFKEER